MSEFICQFCKEDFADHIAEGGNFEDELGTHKGRPACWNCLETDDEMYPGMTPPDSPSLEDTQPNEYFTERGDEWPTG